MAASQPWSAAGPEKPMVTVSPVSSFDDAALALLPPSPSDESVSGVLLVHPVTSSSAASAPPVSARILRMGCVGRDMVCSLDVIPVFQ